MRTSGIRSKGRTSKAWLEVMIEDLKEIEIRIWRKMRKMERNSPKLFDKLWSFKDREAREKEKEREREREEMVK